MFSEPAGTYGLYEPFDEWPGVVTVVFQNNSDEHALGKEQCDKLVREATAFEPSSRPNGN